MVEEVHLARTAVFDDGAILIRLGIPSSTLAKARRDGRLRFVRKGNRILYLGSWLLDWMEQTDRTASGETTST